MNISRQLVKSFCILHSAFCISLAAHAATVGRVVVRQQWPWSTDVRVEYAISGVTDPVDITMVASNGVAALDSAAVRAASKGDIHGISADGVYSFVIDPVAAFGRESIALTSFTVTLGTTPSPPNVNEVVYKILDLKSPYGVTDVTRADILNGKYGSYVTAFSDLDPTFSTSLQDVLIWTGVTNDIYKTEKMVFRRIPAGGKSFKYRQGSSSINGGAGFDVSFSRDFYIGVFEVTQEQYFNIYPGARSLTDPIQYETNTLYSAMRPISRIRWSSYGRGSRTGNYDWPASTTHDFHASSSTYLIPAMQAKTGLLIDYPTHAMWEYACRAGTTTQTYTGNPDNADYAKIGRFYGYNHPKDNTVPRNTDLSMGSNIVGSYLPNAYGLYDMLGNVGEWCLDRYLGNANLSSVTYGEDPVGPTEADQTAKSVNTLYRVCAGGAYLWNPGVIYGDDAARRVGADDRNQAVGLRLCIWLTNHDDGTF